MAAAVEPEWAVAAAAVEAVAAAAAAGVVVKVAEAAAGRAVQVVAGAEAVGVRRRELNAERGPRAVRRPKQASRAASLREPEPASVSFFLLISEHGILSQIALDLLCILPMRDQL